MQPDSFYHFPSVVFQVSQSGQIHASLSSIRLVPSRFSICAVIYGKDLVSSRCTKSLCARQITIPYSFARINNKWRLGTSLIKHFELKKTRSEAIISFSFRCDWTKISSNLKPFQCPYIYVDYSVGRVAVSQ